MDNPAFKTSEPGEIDPRVMQAARGALEELGFQLQDVNESVILGQVVRRLKRFRMVESPTKLNAAARKAAEWVLADVGRFRNRPTASFRQFSPAEETRHSPRLSEILFSFLTDFVSRLDEIDADVLRLRMHGKLKFRSIAEVKGLSTQTVHRRYTHLVARLRAELLNAAMRDPEISQALAERGFNTPDRESTEH